MTRTNFGLVCFACSILPIPAPGFSWPWLQKKPRLGEETKSTGKIDDVSTVHNYRWCKLWLLVGRIGHLIGLSKASRCNVTPRGCLQFIVMVGYLGFCVSFRYITPLKSTIKVQVSDIELAVVYSRPAEASHRPLSHIQL